jgi:hypothetical protein
MFTEVDGKCVMYIKFESGDIWGLLRAKSTKLRPSRLEQDVLPSVFHTEPNNILKEDKLDATMADHLFARGPTRFRKTQDHHLIQLGGVVLP